MFGAVSSLLFLLFNFIRPVYLQSVTEINPDAFEKEHYVFWPNGTVPFYITPDHFDSEQSMTILRALSLFAFMTCLKFSPVMVPPGDEHVLVFENPTGIRKCVLRKHGHLSNGPHMIHMGYDCLATPMIERIIMRALGFPLEHNRMDRDDYVDVQMENIEPTAFELYTKEFKQPPELRQLPYDISSVMHFGDREYSKNGHRTIIFKDPEAKQSRAGLSSTDVRKIEIVYGKECRKRDRQEKTDLCRSYPTRRSKRSIVEENRSLRVNPDITPPPEIVNGNRNLTGGVSATLNNLGISGEVQAVIDDVYKLTGKALKNARAKHCNDTKPLREGDAESAKNSPDILGIIEVVAEYAQSMVDNAVANMSAFCDEASSVDKYQSYLRFRCVGYVDMRGICRETYRSTKTGRVVYSTQHRPIILQSTWHIGGVSKSPKEKLWRRVNGSEVSRVKREIKDSNAAAIEVSKNVTDIQVDKKEDGPSRSGNDSAKADEIAAVMDRVETPDVSVKQKFAPRTRDSSADESENSDSDERERKSSSEEQRTAKDRRKSSSEDERTTKDRWKQNSEEERSPKERPKNNPEDEPRVSERPRLNPNKQREKPKSYGGGGHKNLPTTVVLSKKNLEFYTQRRWPRGVVRYMIDKKGNFDIADVRMRLDEVNQLLKKHTCVRLEEIWERDANKHDDYLVLDHSPDYVTGRVGGKQFFGASELLKGGQHRQHAAMMVMAMLGFYFELSRHDRDKYVRVHLRHIRADKLHHFEKIRSDATFPLEYDFKSATHPAWQYWRKVGRSGIASVATYKDQDPDGSIMKSLGQHEDLLSESDYIKINSVYGIECMTGSGAQYDDSRKNSKYN